MDWMLEGLLQGTQLQKIYNQKIETLRKKYGLRKGDIDILYFLYKSGEHNTSKDISDLNLFSKGYISQSVSRLEEHQIIYAIKDEADRRYMHIMLTDRAEGILEEITALRKQMFDIIFKGVTQGERAVLFRVSRKVNENIRSALENQAKKMDRR